MIALHGCSVMRSPDGGVEIAEAEPAHRAFPLHVTERLGVCLKIGPEHDVRSDGRTVRYPADALCVRAPGCVWGTADTGPAGFLSLDLDAALLPVTPSLPRGAAMTFVPGAVIPGFVSYARALRNATPSQSAALVCELVLTLERAGAIASDELRGRAPARGAARAREILEARLHEPPSIVELAAEIGTNRFALTRAFKQHFGMAPSAFVLGLRVERARERLARGSEAQRVAIELGFADQSHFTRAFKRVVGITPGVYAQQIRAHSFKPVAR